MFFLDPSIVSITKIVQHCLFLKLQTKNSYGSKYHRFFFSIDQEMLPLARRAVRPLVSRRFNSPGFLPSEARSWMEKTLPIALVVTLWCNLKQDLEGAKPDGVKYTHY